MNRRTYMRIGADILLLASVLFFPWWLSAAIALASCFIFNWYYEAVIAGFLLDALYGVSVPAFHGMRFVATVAAALAVAASLYARTRLRYYE